MTDSTSAIRGAASDSKEAADNKPRITKSSKGPGHKRRLSYGFKSPIQRLRKEKEDSFGVRLALIRIMLGQTQESFGNLLLTNRQTIAMMERCDQVDDLKDDMLFRLYYFTKEVMDNNTNYSKDVRILVQRILIEVRTCIADRTE